MSRGKKKKVLCTQTQSSIESGLAGQQYYLQQLNLWRLDDLQAWRISGCGVKELQGKSMFRSW
jgi:hypothetical protein